MISGNLGKLDRMLRFALAFWWLGPWAPKYGIACTLLLEKDAGDGTVKELPKNSDLYIGR